MKAELDTEAIEMPGVMPLVDRLEQRLGNGWELAGTVGTHVLLKRDWADSGQSPDWCRED